MKLYIEEAALFSVFIVKLSLFKGYMASSVQADQSETIVNVQWLTK